MPAPDIGKAAAGLSVLILLRHISILGHYYQINIIRDYRLRQHHHFLF